MATERDMQEKQALIERQLEERQRLQNEIRNARRVHSYELARLHQGTSAFNERGHEIENQGNMQFGQVNVFRL